MQKDSEKLNKWKYYAAKSLRKRRKKNLAGLSTNPSAINIIDLSLVNHFHLISHYDPSLIDKKKTCEEILNLLEKMSDMLLSKQILELKTKILYFDKIPFTQASLKKEKINSSYDFLALFLLREGVYLSNSFIESYLPELINFLDVVFSKHTLKELNQLIETDSLKKSTSLNLLENLDELGIEKKLLKTMFIEFGGAILSFLHNQWKTLKDTLLFRLQIGTDQAISRSARFNLYNLLLFNIYNTFN